MKHVSSFLALLCLFISCAKKPVDPTPTPSPTQTLSYSVISNGDSGPGTLREALTLKSPQISFDQSVSLIQLQSELPVIDYPVNIDPGDRTIVIDGAQMGSSGSGFDIRSKNVFLKNLVLARFPQNGIRIENVKGDIRKNPAEGVFLQNLFILMNQGDGIYIKNSDSVLIIESRIEENQNGLYLTDSAPAETHCGDIILTRSTIAKNRENGVFAENLLRGVVQSSVDSQQHPIGISALDIGLPEKKNTISQNGAHGIWLKNTASTMIVVSTNEIKGNAGSGVFMSHGSSSAFIGADGFNPGPTNAWANTISHNLGHGVWIQNNNLFDESINGVYISVSANQIKQNQLNGLFLDHASSVLVGGVGVGTLSNPIEIDPNTISENGKNGIQISGSGLIAGKEGSFIWNTHVSANIEEAIKLDSGATKNRVGNLDSVSIFGPAKRNKIHSLSAQSVRVEGVGTNSNFIVGNELGCNGSSQSISIDPASLYNDTDEPANETFYMLEADKNYASLIKAGYAVTMDYLNWLKSLFNSANQTNTACTTPL